MRTAKLSSKSQIVIPAEVRRQLGIQPGDTLNLAVEGERIVITKESPLAALERLRSLGRGMWREMEEEIERSRSEWEEYSRELERTRSVHER
jgi:antitoxin PrlF